MRLAHSAFLAGIFTTIRRGGLVALASALVSCGGGDGTAPTITSVRFVSQPVGLVPGKPFTVSVELVGSGGNRETRAKDQVTITAVGATLSGSTTVAAVQGLATFDGLTVAVGASTAQLNASAGGLSVSSPPLAIKADVPSLARSSVVPAPCSIIANATVPLTFTFLDAFDNPVASAPISLSTSLSGTVFTPSSGTTTSAGQFSATIKAPAGSVPVTATVAGTALAFATPFTVVASPTAPAAVAMTFPGSTNGTLTQCINVGFPFVAHRFTTAAATGASFTVNSAGRPDFAVLTDPPADVLAVAMSQSPATAEWLLPAGTYQFLVTGGTGGAYSVAASTVAANSGSGLRYFVTQGTYSGQTLTAGDRVLDQIDNSYYDLFVIAVRQPCTITMRSTALDAYLFVFDPAPDGDGLEDDNSGGGSDAQITLGSCTSPSGPLVIGANTYFPETGAYTLTITFNGTPALRAGADGPRTITVNGSQLTRSRMTAMRKLFLSRK